MTARRRVRVGSIPDQVDVVLGKWKWEQGIISRSERLNAFGGSVLVPTRSDLILLKLAAGGYKISWMPPPCFA